MRPARLFGGMALVLGLAAHAWAQTVPYPAVVSQPEAEVRSGPSDKPEMYATNKLRRGETVEVLRELEGGWLAIKPPPGSFSWMNARFLKPINRTTWVVVAHPDVRVPVLFGSSLRNDKPTVQGVEVVRGTQVVSAGEPRSAEDGIWQPIEPPPGEVRYLRAEAVVKSGAGLQTASAASPAGSGPPPAPGAPSASAPQVSDPRWLAAHQAEQAGNRAEAVRRYEELGNAARNTDTDLAMRAYTRAQHLRDLDRAGPPQPVRRAGATYPIPPANERLQPVPASLQASAGPSSCCVPCQTTSSSPGSLQRTGLVRLRRSAWWLDGQPTYCLLNGQGQVSMYATAQPGLSLEPHLNRTVELFGSIVYRGYPPVYHIRAVQVTPQP